MNITPNKKLAAIIGTGALALGAVAAAPAAFAAPPTTTAITTSATSTTETTPPEDFASPEDRARATALVRAWFEDFLGRDAGDDADQWVDQLVYTPPALVLTQILSDPEYNGAQVDGLYTEYLDRSAEGDPAADYWFNGVNARDFLPEWVAQNILASAEYEAMATDGDAGSPQLLVTSWFGDVLDREPSAGELQYWSLFFEATPQGDASNLEVLRTLWYTPEAVNHRVTDHYDALLDRTPEAGELAYWSAVEVTSDLDAQIEIALTQEYQEIAEDHIS